MLARMRTSMLVPTMQMVLKRSAASMAASCSQAADTAAVCLFGKKHFGQPLSKVVAEDPSFCRWILKKAQEADASSALQDNAAWLRSNAAHLEVTAQKHNGRDLSALAAADPVHCQWILRQAKEKHASPELRANANWLMENAPHLEEQGLFAIGGKYRGRLMSELAAEDPSYCRWVLREAQEPNVSHGLKAMAEWLLKNVPHLQEGPLAPGAGRDLPALVAEDPAYCQWVLREAKDKHSSPELRASEQQDLLVVGGKYRGRKMSELASEDPAYCQWILREAQDPSATHGMKAMAGWLLQNVPNLQEPAMIFATGPQHRGRLLSQVLVEDPSYCQWVIRTTQEGSKDRALLEQAAWLLENAPYLKEVPVVRMTSVHRGVPIPQLVAEDPGWCCFVLTQTEARSKGFAEAAAWLRENASELLQAEDDAARAQIGREFFKRYGKHFVVRYGKYRMKTFAAVIKEEPKFVAWAMLRSTKDGASKNVQHLAAFARQQSSEESEEPASGSLTTKMHKAAKSLAA